jgi:hypothetical protein
VYCVSYVEKTMNAASKMHWHRYAVMAHTRASYLEVSVSEMERVCSCLNLPDCAAKVHLLPAPKRTFPKHVQLSPSAAHLEKGTDEHSQDCVCVCARAMTGRTETTAFVPIRDASRAVSWQHIVAPCSVQMGAPPTHTRCS